MEHYLRERQINRIVSGALICPVNVGGTPTSFLLKKPNRIDRYLADILYEDTLYRAGFEGMLTEEEAEDYLIRFGMWTSENNKMIEKLKKDIEEIKVGLFKAFFDSKKSRTVRKILENTRFALSKLEDNKHLFDYLTIKGYASMVKTHFILGTSLYDMAGKKVWPENNWDKDDRGILEKVLNYTNAQSISIKTFRELARTEPWHSYWKVNQNDLFGVPTVDWTEEQRTLSLFSIMYENTYQHPECPCEAVVEDDDALDGWMIDQRKKAEQDKKVKTAENTFQNLKGDEVYIPAKSNEDINKINDLNDFSAKMTKKERFEAVEKYGRVNELDLPDKKRQLMEVANQQYISRVKGK